MSISIIQRWFNGQGKRKNPRRVPKTRRNFERLERREVFAGLSGGLSNGTLTINGTTAGDNIALTQTGNTVRIDGYTNTWSASQISQIRINAGGGDDTVRIAVSKQMAATLVADGGVGRDALYTTAQPTSWAGFEFGTLISPPAGTDPAPNGSGVQVVRTGNTGPYTVSYYRRGDGPNGGELEGVFQTSQEADNAVARLQRWAGEINNGSYWDVVKITVQGEGTATPGGSNSSYATAFANAFQDLANRYNQFQSWRNQIINQVNSVAERYRPYYNIYQNAIRIRNAVDNVLKNASMSIEDVYRRYSNQSNYVWANPSFLTIAAQQIRQSADAMKNYVNQNLSGDIWANVRASAYSALQIMYDGANTMDNLAGAIKRAQGR